MNKTVLIVLATWIGSMAADANMILKLDGLQVEQCSGTLFAFQTDGAAVVFDGGNLHKATVISEAMLKGASGSFTVFWSATQKSDSMNAALWKFGPETACLDPKKVGWGVISSGEKDVAQQMSGNEAVLLKFDLSNLKLEPGYSLSFSVQVSEGDSFNLYRRTGVHAGEVATSIAHLHSGFSKGVPVCQPWEYAITDAGFDGGRNLRITGFSVEVIAESDIAPVVDGISLGLLY